MAEHHKEIIGTSDRACALICGSPVDSTLIDLLATKMIDLSDAEKNSLFFEPNGPLGTFSDKIQLAYALGLINDDQRLATDRIRKIRNVFAHTIRPITFEEPQVSAECKRLPPMVSIEKEPTGHISLERWIYIVVSFRLLSDFLEAATKHAKTRMDREYRRMRTLRKS